jgi:Domain of unknown function (DUF4399)
LIFDYFFSLAGVVIMTLRNLYLCAGIALYSASPSIVIAQAAKTPWPEGAKPYFISPKDGDTITGPVMIVMGLKGLGVAPAGVEKEKTGHHHILIDADAPKGDELLNPLPADDNYKHFGGGQTETVLMLKPGKHTLQLIVGDHNHVPYNPPLISTKITINVR